MRKSTPLKLGLNVRKPKAPTSDALAANAQRQRPSVFSDDNDDIILEEKGKEPVTTQPYFAGGSQSRESARLAKDLEETDPSVYAYDDVYDSINAARSKINAARKKNDDSKPKYMEKLMETAKRRQVQQEVVKERVLEKERQREGEMYADKETFVTSAYKELKDQRQQLVKEEEKQDEEDSRKSAADSKSKQLFGASAGFYREFLDQVDREDVSKVAISLSAGEKGPGMPEDRIVTAKPENLSAGLNLGSKGGSRAVRTAIRDDSIGQGKQPLAQNTAGQKQPARRLYQRRDNGLEEHERSKAESSIQEREARIRKYARRNDGAA
ncbi:hypothetical protein GGI22_002714, partial [Coemansia erecta]